ncbi:hypothetical protein ACKLNO_10415 [Neisseriaceae bacterium B1]
MNHKSIGFAWVRLPIWWIRTVKSECYLLKTAFPSSRRGEGIACLKVYLALLTNIDFKSGVVEKMTYQDIEDVADVSRPMISKSLKALSELGLLSIQRKGRSNRYCLKIADGSSTQFAKAPKWILENCLSNIPNKGVHALNALKIYIYLLHLRDNSLDDVKVSYENMARFLGINRQFIRKSLMILVTAGFITIINANKTKDNQRECNIYHVKGLRKYHDEDDDVT